MSTSAPVDRPVDRPAHQPTAVSTLVLSPAAALRELREAEPLVQCITNTVVAGFTANVLLALGASPAMSDVPGEAGAFASVADGLLVNLGTPHTEQREAAREAVAATRRWVLDPVAAGALPVRTGLAHDLLDAAPAVVRGNPSEVLALAEGGAGGRGVDSVAGPDDAAPAAAALAGRTGSVVAVSGPTDLIVDGHHHTVRVPGGDRLLTRVTGGGCALGATTAAFLAVCDPVSAAVAAHVVHARAAEEAARIATGPGTFAVALLDAIAGLDPASLDDPRGLA